MKNPNLSSICWKYKDSNRNWWEICLWLDEEDTIIDSYGDIHHHWNYTVEIEGRKIHDGWIQGQYDIRPTLETVMIDFSTHMSAVAIGATKHAVEIKKTNKKES